MQKAGYEREREKEGKKSEQNKTRIKLGGKGKL
jgi:hypothetical protein